MSSVDDYDYMLQLDANIEVQTTVKNPFKKKPIFSQILGNNDSVFSHQAQFMTTAEKSGDTTTKDSKETYIASGSNENIVCATADSSAGIGNSVNFDTPSRDEVPAKMLSAEISSSMRNLLKKANVMERIVFCIDMSTDMENAPFVTKGAHLSSLSMIKRVIGIFVQNKYFVDKKHEYSLMVLYDKATWVCEFTNNTRKLIETLENLTETLECTSCDLSSVISLLTKKYPFILSTKPADVLCVYRIILIYGRSSCMIHLSDPSDRNIILKSPSLFLDVLYIHEPQSATNNCLDIYDYFCNLDEHDKSYIFEMTRSVSNLHSFMGKLLSHPFQRALQKNTNYRLRDIVSHDT